MDQSESPTKKRRIEAPVKEEPIPFDEEPILFKVEEHIQPKEEETELAQLSQLLREIRKITRRNEELAKLLTETLEETRKLKTHLDYLKVLDCLKVANPSFNPVSIFMSPSKRRPVKPTSPRKRANMNSG